MNVIFVLLICLLQICFNLVQCQDNPTVVTNRGTFRGSIMTTRRNKTIYAFRGIRYAKSPEGDLRFQPPQPILTYNEPVDATADGPLCPQPALVPGVPMSEDCLRINVYTRCIPKSSPLFGTCLAPVIFYLHGGSLSYGGGLSILVGPQYIMDQNVVLVTLNYRLATLGFLSTGTAEAPGNNGFKDQVIGLRWVQKFISYFGGDPNRVSLMGFSAGSLSVSLHVLSPMSQGLFNTAILMSASAISQVQLQTQQFKLAQKHAGILNCDNSTAQTILACLKALPATTIANSALSLVEFASAFPILIWLPVIEPDFGQERFITVDPTTQLQSGCFKHIPIMSGISTYEFGFQALKLDELPSVLIMQKSIDRNGVPAGIGREDILRNDNLRTQLDQNWNTIAPIILMYERNTKRSSNISQQLREYYIGGGPLLNDNATAERLWKLIADGPVGFGVHRFSYIMAEVSSAPVYYYKFSYKGRFGNEVDPVTGETFGPVHGTEQIYIFPSIANPTIALSDPESDMVDIMTAMLSNHATVGQPIRLLLNPPVLAWAKWPRLLRSTLKYLDIGETLDVETGLNDDRFEKWDELFPLSN